MTEVTLSPREAFLAALASSANVSASCDVARISRETAYRWRAEDVEFAKAWRTSLRIGIGGLEDSAMLRSRDGLTKYVVSGGRVVLDKDGNPLTEQVYSDSLTMFLLKAHDPELYKDRTETTGTVNITIAADDAGL